MASLWAIAIGILGTRVGSRVQKGCFVLVLALPASSYRNRASFTVQTAGVTYMLVFCVVLGYSRYTRDGEHGTSRQEILAVLRYQSRAILAHMTLWCLTLASRVARFPSGYNMQACLTRCLHAVALPSLSHLY